MSSELLHGQDPLDLLRPIIPPEHDISWWPLAPGWWILMALVLLTALLAWWLRPRIVAHQIKLKRWQSTHQLLETLYLKCNQETDICTALQYYLQGSNVIFKRAINYFGENQEIAALAGDNWVQFLKKIYIPKTGGYAYLYGDQLYAKHCTENIRLDDLHSWACSWIEAFKKQVKKNV